MRLGLDLGGTKIEIIALDDQGEPLLRRRINTPQGDYAASINAIVNLVETAERELGQTGSVGIGIPGAESLVTGRIKNANSTCLNGMSLRQDLQTRLGRPVRLANDANCFALSEATDGAGKGAASVFGVILGTGVGGGIVLDGKPLIGRNAIAGEWGHNALPRLTPDDLPLRPCFCGRNSCIETYLSGPALSADHQLHTGVARNPEAIQTAADQGDKACQASLERYAERLARALASVINLLDPEVIILGGGLSKLNFLYDAVPRLWTSHVFSDHIATRLCPPIHGDSSGVRGAAWLWNA